MPLRRRRTLFFSLTIVIGSWMAAYALTLFHLRNETLGDGLKQAEALAHNFEAELTRTLDMVDLLSLSVEPRDSATPASLHFSHNLNDALRQAPYLRSISVLTPEGRVLASSTPANVGKQVSLQDFFPEIDPAAANFRIGTPWQGRDLNEARPSTAEAPVVVGDPYFLPVIRKIGQQNQTLVVLAALNPDYFLLHFTKLLSAHDGRVQIVRLDGRLLASTAGNDLPGSERRAGDVEILFAQTEFGRMEQTLPDSQRYLSAFHVSSHYPAAIVVHLDRDSVLDRWRDNVRGLSAIVFPILAALTAAMLMYWRRQQRLIERERELDAQRRLTASLFEATSDAVFMTAPDGAILAANPAFERISGYDGSEVLGSNPRLLSSGLHDRNFYQTMWHSIVTTGHWQGEITNRRRDGSLYLGLLTINAVRDETGRLAHYVGVTADIGERKRQEAEILAARDKAEAASRAKSTFLATMSHELRTPLNGMLGMTELLLRSSLDHRQRHRLEVVRSSAESLLGILNQILDYAHLETHGIDIERAPFDPVALIHDVVRLFAPQALAKSLALAASTAGTLPPAVIGDTLRLQQILMHLLGNAIKFTEEGRIEVQLSLNDTGDRLRISVSDTGIGIAEAVLPTLFTAFMQGDGSLSRQHGGTGLGLAISRRLAEAMGGDLTAHSQVSHGSCFVLELPLECP